MWIAGGLLVLWVLLLGLLVACGELIVHSAAIGAIDRHITSAIVSHRSAGLDQAMKVVTWWGSWVAVLAATAASAVVIWRRRSPVGLLVVVLVAWLGELLAVTITKAVVQRPRPPLAIRLVTSHGWAFPSGHTANAVVVSATAALFGPRLRPGHRVRVATWVLASSGF